ncbi:MAG TPA: hypothetical protein VGK16_06195 [Candidatus Limnocylindrales bacterium]
MARIFPPSPIIEATSAGAIAAAVVVHTVHVKVVGDDEFRGWYGSPLWQDKAGAAVETADNAMSTSFGIDMVIDSYANWDTAPDSARFICNDPSSLLDELKKDFPLPSGSTDLVIGYTHNLLLTGQRNGCYSANHLVVSWPAPPNPCARPTSGG